MKKVIAKTTCIVTFFNGSHYWGGQLDTVAKKQNLKQKMKQNCETHWYALILQSLTVKDYWYVLCFMDEGIPNQSDARNPLSHICFQPDAQKRMNNLSPVAADILNIMLHDLEYWQQPNQLIKVTKLLVNAIGNLESQEASLANCMLELIRYA